MMGKWWHKLIIESDDLSMLIPEIHHLDSPVYPKSEYDAFYETPLMETLNNSGSKDLIVTGVMTHLCVETTVRSAFVRGFRSFLPVNGTATYNEAHHRASLLNLSHGFAVTATIESIIDSINEDSNA